MKTFIRWSGNKTNYKTKIIPMIPTEFNTYIEPFVGSGSIFLSVQPEKWIINDINEDLINTWNLIKQNPNQLIKSLKLFNKTFADKTIEGKKIHCHMIANKLNHISLGIKRTTYFIMLKFCSFFGKIIQNNKYVFPGLDIKHKNTINSFELSPKYYKNLQDINQYLNKTSGTIFNTDYKQILRKAKQCDFVFLDPPYIEQHNYQFNYNIDEKLTEEFVQDLYKEVQKLDKRKVKWIMTQAGTEEIRDLFKEYTIIEMPVYRHTRKQYEIEFIILSKLL
jgi:DNA adenine methylase